MVLRFFAVTWAAILATLLLFAVFVAALNWLPPDSARRAIERETVERELQYVAAQAGTEGLEDFWRDLTKVHPGLSLVRDETCAAEQGISAGPNDCFMLIASEEDLRLLTELRPLLLPLLLGALSSAAAAIALSRWMARPIRTVDRGLKRLASGALDTRIGADLDGSDRALRQLGTAFDHAAARLQDLADSRERLFHDVSHEIRSPLARMRVAASLLAKAPRDPATILMQMETDITRLDQLVEAILTLARLEASGAKPSLQSFDLRDLVEPIVESARFEAMGRGVRVVQEGEDELPVEADPEMLYRAIENLVRNALRFSPNRGQVTLRFRRDPDRVRLSVSDQGPGVPEADLHRIFSAFTRLEADLAGPVGVGLGLAIVARSIELHGGEVQASNRPGGGLCVALSLPVAR